MIAKRKDISAYLLAGGKSSRMGTDKGLVHLHGKPMLQHGLEILQSIFSQVTLISNHPDYPQLGQRVIPDLIPEMGPIGGIYTGLEDSRFELSFFVACDMPMISREAILHLLTNAKNNEITIAAIGGKTQPLFGLYPKIFSGEIKKNIEHQQLKMMDLVQKLKGKCVSLDELGLDIEAAFANVNTPEDLERMESKAKTGEGLKK